MTEPLNPEQLRSFTPLNVLSEQQWRELRPQLVPQHLLAGQLLFRQGDQARTTYYLLSGELLLRDAAGGEERLQAGSEASCHPLSPSLPRQHEVWSAFAAKHILGPQVHGPSHNSKNF